MYEAPFGYHGAFMYPDSDDVTTSRLRSRWRRLSVRVGWVRSQAARAWGGGGGRWQRPGGPLRSLLAVSPALAAAAQGCLRGDSAEQSRSESFPAKRRT